VLLTVIAMSSSAIRSSMLSSVDYALPFESSQTLQLHVEDRLRLDLRQAEVRHQAFARLGNGLRPADQLDDLIEMVERDLEAFQDVIASLGLPELELGSPADHFAPELDEGFDEFQQVEHLRAAADDRQHDDAEARLQRRVLVEVVEHDLGHFAALQLDDDAHAVAVGFIPQVGNALDDLVAHQVGDPLDQVLLVDLIRDLGDDQRDPVPFLARLDRRLGPHLNGATAGRVCLHDPIAAENEAACGEIRTGDQANQLLELFAA
jgi:hypothetical protein